MGILVKKTKLRIFKTNVLSSLLYGAESWKITETVLKKLEVFQRRCLRSILRIFWPNVINNEDFVRPPFYLSLMSFAREDGDV